MLAPLQAPPRLCGLLFVCVGAHAAQGPCPLQVLAFPRPLCQFQARCMRLASRLVVLCPCPLQVLAFLRDSALAPSISLLLNPRRDTSDMPLKSYYRFALPDLRPGGGWHTCKRAHTTAYTRQHACLHIHTHEHTRARTSRATLLAACLFSPFTLHPTHCT